MQAAVTGEGPYANWSKHVSDPFGYNLLTILVRPPLFPMAAWGAQTLRLSVPKGVRPSTLATFLQQRHCF